MGKTLYVGNLVFSVTKRELRRLFARYGTVTKARIVTDPIRGTGRSLGFGFVEMADGAEAAIAGLNGTKFNNCILTVNEALSAESRPREERSVMPRFLDAVNANPNTKFFRVVDSSADHPSDWELEPLKTDLLSDTDSDGLHVMKALNLLPDGSIRECYMDMNLPERISD